MDVVSLAWRTDLALLASAGSVVEHHPTFVVVRTPSAPQRRWGNFLLLRRRPLTRDLPLVRAAFRHHLPEAHHEAFGIDAPASPDDLAPFRSSGFSTSVSVVLAAEQVHPGRPTPGIVVRELVDDHDWAQRVALGVGHDLRADSVYLEFVRARAADERAMTRHGGAWFGAFEDGLLLGALGVVSAGVGLARLQGSEIPRRVRGRALEEALLQAAASHVRTDGGARLVVVAEPHYPALDHYRTLGFVDVGLQLQAERALEQGVTAVEVSPPAG